MVLPHRGLLGAFAFAAFLAGSAPTVSAQTRIACLGDSITFGARVADREHNAWPALLGAYLGTDHEVRNFGVGGTTLLRRADRPYLETDRCAVALAWSPHVAVIVLGTNDTCQNDRRKNWQHAGDLQADARALIGALRSARPDVRVILASPPPMFPDREGLTAARQADLRTRAPRLLEIAAAVRAVAAATDGVEYLELRSVLRAEHVGDGVHLTPFGSERIARRVQEAIENEPVPTPDLAQALRDRGIAATTDKPFHDFASLAFALPETGAACRLVQPHRTARGRPWILRARFFGHQPGLDLALLERGFHLVYCDVANLYGGPEALARWDEFYGVLRDLGFARKGVLEGMSRGGLPAVNWAARHPDRVAAVYVDNPVVDFRSWPGGRSGKRSDADWARCLQAYGLTEQQAASYDRMPVDRCAPIAAAGVPLLLVLGTADEVVPPIENGEVLVKRWREAGGPGVVWRKPGSGHHPHGLDPVAPLLRAVLRATGFASMPTTRPTPSAEYRKGAGWPDGTWWSELARLRTLAEEHQSAKLVFLGDSITQGLTGAGDRVARAAGKRPIDDAFGERGALSLGLSGDRTEHLLYRIEHGALATLEPAVLVLQIGVNNINAGKHTATETAAGIAAVLRSLGEHQPQAKVVLCGPFPLGRPGQPRHAAIGEVHERIGALADGRRVFYLDLRGLFVDEDGQPNDRMRGDCVHITAAGQRAWMSAIAPLVTKLLEER